jgi:hypothetical protein
MSFWQGFRYILKARSFILLLSPVLYVRHVLPKNSSFQMGVDGACRCSLHLLSLDLMLLGAKHVHSLYPARSWKGRSIRVLSGSGFSHFLLQLTLFLLCCCFCFVVVVVCSLKQGVMMLSCFACMPMYFWLIKKIGKRLSFIIGMLVSGFFVC